MAKFLFKRTPAENLPAEMLRGNQLPPGKAAFGDVERIKKRLKCDPFVHFKKIVERVIHFLRNALEVKEREFEPDKTITKKQLTMISQLKRRFAQRPFVKKLLESPVDLSAFKEKPSSRFLFGVFIIGFSYLISWPLISFLGILAAYLREPLIFAIGSPLAYGFSHLVFLLGAFIAGKDAMVFMQIFARWALTRLCQRIIGPEVLAALAKENTANSA